MLESWWEGYLRLIGLIVALVVCLPIWAIVYWLITNDDAPQGAGPRGCGADGAGPLPAPATRTPDLECDDCWQDGVQCRCQPGN